MIVAAKQMYSIFAAPKKARFRAKEISILSLLATHSSLIYSILSRDALKE